MTVTTAVVLQVAGTAHGQWLQWGGPNRSFVVDTSVLADRWPEYGPERLWHRTLGSGYSSIVVDDGVLYTMYRRKNTSKYEYTIALDAATGKTIWDMRNTAQVPPETADHGKRFTGPNATPLIVGDRLYTVGRNAMLHCRQKTDGTVLWEHDLRKDFGAQLETCGFSPSPLAYRNTVILVLGRNDEDQRQGKSLVAFDQETGHMVWQKQTFKIEHASPILISFEGQDQLVLCLPGLVTGVDPGDGDTLWRHDLDPEQFVGVFTTPVWDGKDTLLCSSRSVGCALKLSKQGESTSVEELWCSPKTPLGQATPVLMGGMLIGAKRGAEQSPIMAIDPQSGERLWVKRLFPMSVMIGGGERMIILDAAGTLGLLKITRDGPTVLSQCQVTEQYSFTAPTLVGTTLYVRDEKHIMALDLGSAEVSTGG
jgi:outer membrane protein assembly factor BamB